MDNSIISKILNDWSIRSTDGLASGFNSIDNVVALRESLSKYGITREKSDNIIGNALNSDQEPTKNTNDVWERMVTEKRVSSVLVDAMKNLISGLPNVDKFISMFDSIPLSDIQSAIDMSYIGEFKHISSVIDSIKKQGLGRGELMMVFLMKSCSSGGTSETDLVFNNGEKIDVKEVTNGTIKLSDTSINLHGLQFFRDLHNLVRYIEQNRPVVGNYILTVLGDDVNYKISEKLKTSAIKKSEEFFNSPKISEVNGNIFDLLYYAGKKLKTDNKNIPATIDVNLIGKSPTSLIVNNSDELSDLISTKKDRQKIELDVSPLIDKTEQLIIPGIKDLEYFKKNYSKSSITNELFIEMRHNSGIVVISGNKSKYIPSAELTKYFKFNRLTMGKSEVKYYPSGNAQSNI